MKPTNQNINQLIKRCKKNDSNAQMEVYKCYYKAMYNTSYRILNDEFEAEDIMQEAFLTAFTKLDSFIGEVTFGAWLKKIVINKSLTQLKKNKKYHEVKMEVLTNDEKTNDDLHALDFKKNDINVKLILDSLNKLKKNYRVILTLHLIEGFDYEEITQILNYSNENVRTTIFRAKKKLKQVLLNGSKQKHIYER